MSPKLKSYPEPEGYANVPGLVKSNPRNNKSYLVACLDAFPYWADLLIDLDEKLEELIPGYNISQIKDKFSSMRFFYDAPLGTSPARMKEADALVAEAEHTSTRLLKEYRAAHDRRHHN